MPGRCVSVLALLAALSLAAASCAPVAASNPGPQVGLGSPSGGGKEIDASPRTDSPPTCCANSEMTQSTEINGQTTSIQNPDAQVASPGQVAPSQTANPVSSQPGQVAGGEGQASGGAEAVPGESQSGVPATWPVYVDGTYSFGISYPPGYVISHLSDTELDQLSPRPLAAIYFQDPQTAQSAVAHMAPPAFSIRIFAKEEQQPLEEWLTMTGLLHREAGWSTGPYTGTHESGMAVRLPIFIAPGWFVYVTDGAHVYQLTALGTEAELMLDTFAIN